MRPFSTHRVLEKGWLPRWRRRPPPSRHMQKRNYGMLAMASAVRYPVRGARHDWSPRRRVELISKA